MTERLRIVNDGMRATAVLVACALMGCRGAAAPPEPIAHVAQVARTGPSLDARAGLERLKALKGTFRASSGGKESEAEIEVVARGTAVLQRSAFVAVFYLDGDSILMTLFPDDGNHPRLRSNGFVTREDGRSILEFQFVDITNLKPGAGHINGLTLEIAPDGTVVEHWRWREQLKESTFDITLVRANASLAL